MTNRFIKFIPDDKAEWLQENHPNAFLLLCTIARRARREEGKPDGLKSGECFLGDYKKSGIESRQKYRTALQQLICFGFVEVKETCRTREKDKTGANQNSTTEVTTKTTTKGTKAKLIDNSVWDVNLQTQEIESTTASTTSSTIDQPPSNHEQEGIRRNKKKEDKLLRSSCSDSGSQARQARAGAMQINFSFESKTFEGILEQDKLDWQTAYPLVNLEAELASMKQWILGAGSKGHKSQWRRFITGWLNRAQQQATRSAAYSTIKSSHNNPREAIRQKQLEEYQKHNDFNSSVISFAEEI